MRKMLSNTDLKYSQNKDNNDYCVAKQLEDKEEDNTQYNGQQKDKSNRLSLISNTSNGSPKRVRHMTQVSDVRTIKDEVLQLARMRNGRHITSQASQIRPDLYRIAFDDQQSDDVFDGNDDDNRFDFNGDGLSFDNCISGDNRVINDQKVIATDIPLFGKIIDDQNVELLSSNTTDRHSNLTNVYINQLSLADEVAIAEEMTHNRHVFDSNSQTNDKLENISKTSETNSDKFCVSNQSENIFDNLTTNSDNNDWIRNSSESLVGYNGNPSCSHSNSNKTDVKNVAFRRIRKTRNILLEMPDNSLTSIRDCICCCVQ